MRSDSEVQRAHDVLVGLILDPTLMKKVFLFHHKEQLIAYADALCWCLLHTHNESFGNHLEDIERRLRELGVEVEELPELVDPRRDLT